MGIVNKGIPCQFMDCGRVGVFLFNRACITGILLPIVMNRKKSACQMTHKASVKVCRRISPAGNFAIHFIGPAAAIPQPEVCFPFIQFLIRLITFCSILVKDSTAHIGIRGC